MTSDEKLNRYIELCKRVWEDMVAEDTWPWPEDSQNSQDLVESEHNQQ